MKGGAPHNVANLSQNRDPVSGISRDVPVTRFSRRLLTGVLLVAIPLAASAVFFLAGGPDLKARLGHVSSGMTRGQVE